MAGAALRAHGRTFAWQVRDFDSLGCVAGAALRAHGHTFAWQVRRFDSLGIAGARLDAPGPRLLLRGRRSTSCTWTDFRVASAALRAHGRTFAWQVQHI